MVVPDKYLVRGVKGLPDGVHLSFNKKLRPELICCVCDAVTQNGLKDGKGHIYCQECIGVHTDNCNQFTCSVCGCQMHIKDMSSSEKEWDTLKKMNSACPNEDKMCPFKGTLQVVLQHYKTCDYQGKVMCSLCNTLQDRKTVGDHMKESCPRRVVECVFCYGDVDWCDKRNHERSCRQRPATCEHCRKNFKTFSELEDNHYSQCPELPVNCAFKELGCKFQAARREVIQHEKQVKHTELLVQEVCHMKNENKTLRQSLQQQEKEYKKNVKDLSDLVAKLREEINDLQQHRIQLEEKVKKQQQQINAKLHEEINDLQQHRIQLDREVKQQQQQLDATEEAVGFLKREVYLGPQQSVYEHVWKLHPYSNLKRAAATSRNGPLSSGVLSINKPGYSVELVADVCRPAVGKATSPHLALKMRIHKGDYDDLLPWPFANKIRLVLVNQLDEAKSLRFELDPSTAPNAAECLKKPAQDQLNPMFGYSQLISIPLLENDRKGFLLRNCVVLKFSVLACE